MSKKLGVIAVATMALAAGLRWLTDHEWFKGIELVGIILTQPDLTPGAWYCYYLGDYMTEHPGVTQVRSPPVELRNGSFIWATETPEWDRGWFEKRGWEFPAQWIPYSQLEGMTIPMHSVGGP